MVSTLKNVIIGSDQNLDLLKCHSHNQTLQVMEDLNDSGFISSILKPTGITHETSTLIANILSKGNGCFNFDSFVLIEDLSVHYPNSPPTRSFDDKVIHK